MKIIEIRRKHAVSNARITASVRRDQRILDRAGVRGALDDYMGIHLANWCSCALFGQPCEAVVGSEA